MRDDDYSHHCYYCSYLVVGFCVSSEYDALLADGTGCRRWTLYSVHHVYAIVHHYIVSQTIWPLRHFFLAPSASSSELFFLFFCEDPYAMNNGIIHHTDSVTNNHSFVVVVCRQGAHTKTNTREKKTRKLKEANVDDL